MDPAQHRPDFAFDGRYPGVYKDRQHVAAAKLYGAMGIGRDDRAARGQAMLRNFGFFDSPHAAFVFLPEPFGIREATDCGMYAQTLMLLLLSLIHISTSASSRTPSRSSWPRRATTGSSVPSIRAACC